MRNRRGLIRAVEPFDGGIDGRVHLVTLEYLDTDGESEDLLIWEREPGARVLEPTVLPNPVAEPPMPPDEFDALVRATRWTALSPYVAPDNGPTPAEHVQLAAPLHGAIQVEDFQLVPLLTALRMPRVALLLADDVGLGKTVEAGLILAELLRRRRVRRVLVLCPASLRRQWQQEMWEKFALRFDMIDRPATHALHKRFGLDANPWRMLPRLITSYDYLKQSDVFEQFRAACRMPEGSPYLPWDLLIVDEVHNLTPAPFGEESDAARMLRLLAPWFEHKLFLTATPHNGHTRSFTGLLETLDPVRFTRTSEPLTSSEKARVEQVVIRRLKREINASTTPPRFVNRELRELSITLDPAERELAAAYQAFRARLYALIAGTSRQAQHASAFAIEVLGKRLLSCPAAFADSWQRYRRGLSAEEVARVEEVQAAERAVRDETDDDREAESRTALAAHTVGAWLQPFAPRLESEMAAMDQALTILGLDRMDVPITALIPTEDARFAALERFIRTQLCLPNDAFRDDERLVIFTEYKTTLDSLAHRLHLLFPEDGRVRVLFGGMDDTEREVIKRAFNDPQDPVRLLIATDAASEGLNLQETARLLLHYDVPWNPARLEQRNGRLDRHGQARDVLVHYFVTDDDADLNFLAYVVHKVHTIRDDLGATGEIFDQALERRLIAGEDDTRVRRELDIRLERARGRAAVPSAVARELGQAALQQLEDFAAELDLDAAALRDTLDIALGLGVGRPRLDGPDARGRFRLTPPIPPAWQALVDDVLRLDAGAATQGALPGIIFDAAQFVHDIGGRPIFRPERDTVLLHLGHPLFYHALAVFARARFPGSARADTATRWTVRRGPVPPGVEALMLLTVEERAVNELRETFHHWVRTLCVPIRHGELGVPLPHVPARALRLAAPVPTAADIARARDLWDEVERDVRQLVGTLASELTERLQARLAEAGRTAIAQENERLQSRQGEVSALIAETTLQRLEREIVTLRQEAQQGVLFDRDARLATLERSIAEREEEVRRRRAQYEELRDQLRRERERVLRYLLPKRYTLRGTAYVFPVAVEIRLPEVP
jgi:superfamily II DNA or RNA helicase